LCVLSFSAGVTALADAISGNGAISTVIVNMFPLPIQDIKSKAELDFSGKRMKVEDAIIIAAVIGLPGNVSRTILPQPCYHLSISLSVKRGRYSHWMSATMTSLQTNSKK
jgi:hypothetical protein